MIHPLSDSADRHVRRRAAHFAWLLPAVSVVLACSSSPAPPSSAAGSAGHAGTPGGGGPAGGANQAGGNNDGNNHGGTAENDAGTAGADSSAGGQSGQPATEYWKPRAGASWQWQLSESVGTPLDVEVYDIDWEADAAIVEKLHAAGIKVVCYVSVGSWEDFRPDAADFPADVIGRDYEGWPGEKYVDIRSATLRDIISARFDTCRAKGFDAIEPDNQDVYELGAASGFPLTEQDGVEYGKWLAAAAHSRGLGIGQKNAAGITGQLVGLYDWALSESCYSDGDWCGELEPYVDADKPVFMCEYAPSSFAAACKAWQPKSFSPILKSLDLDAAITFCP